jgi:hypothetical protein
VGRDDEVCRLEHRLHLRGKLVVGSIMNVTVDTLRIEQEGVSSKL